MSLAADNPKPVPAGKSLRHNDPSTMLAWRGLRKTYIPLWAKFLGVAFVAISLVPLAFAIRERVNVQKALPKIHFFQDMDNQPKLKAQDPSPIFADGRANRPPVLGTVARGELRLDDHFERGYTLKDGQPVFFADFPPQLKIDEAFIRRGQTMYNINCSVCHGKDGHGNGPVAVRAKAVGALATGWAQPTDLTSESVVRRENGHIYNTINNGIRNMGGYGHSIEPKDRWAIVAYVRALQLRQSMPADRLTPEQRQAMQ